MLLLRNGSYQTNKLNSSVRSTVELDTDMKEFLYSIKLKVILYFMSIMGL